MRERRDGLADQTNANDLPECIVALVVNKRVAIMRHVECESMICCCQPYDEYDSHIALFFCTKLSLYLPLDSTYAHHYMDYNKARQKSPAFISILAKVDDLTKKRRYEARGQHACCFHEGLLENIIPGFRCVWWTRECLFPAASKKGKQDQTHEKRTANCDDQ